MQEPAGQEPDVRLVELAGERAAQAATPEPKAQRNFTDPDRRIMKNANGAFIQAYNGQAVVDDTAQIIVAADVTDCASDVPSLLLMLAQADANTGQAPTQALPDTGYCSKDNLAALVARAQRSPTQVLVATGRLRHGEVPATPAGTGPAPAGGQGSPGVVTDKERMAGLLRTDAGRAAYARRKDIVEPVFGQMSSRQNAKQLRLRGTDGARGEWRLLAGCHNILKMFTSGLPVQTGTALAVG